jgi:hypothetical protein
MEFAVHPYENPSHPRLLFWDGQAIMSILSHTECKNSAVHGRQQNPSPATPCIHKLSYGGSAELETMPLNTSWSNFDTNNQCISFSFLYSYKEECRTLYTRNVLYIFTAILLGKGHSHVLAHQTK